MNSAHHLNVNEIILVGHSFGGYIALALTQQRPDLFDRLILVEPTVFPFIMRKSFNPLQLIPLFFKNFKAASSFLRTGITGILPARKNIFKGNYNKAKFAFLNGVLGHPADWDHLHPLLKQCIDANISSFALESKTAFQYSLSTEQITAIQTRTLILATNQSPEWFRYIAHQLYSHLPQSDFKIISAPTHWIQFDQAENFNSVVEDFLNWEQR